jgi:hypothetical protein
MLITRVTKIVWSQMWKHLDHKECVGGSLEISSNFLVKPD